MTDQDITDAEEQAHFDEASRRFFAAVKEKDEHMKAVDSFNKFVNNNPADILLAWTTEWPEFRFKPHPNMTGVLMIRSWEGGRPFQYHITEHWLKLPSTDGPFFFHDMEFFNAMRAIVAISQLEDKWVE